MMNIVFIVLLSFADISTNSTDSSGNSDNSYHYEQNLEEAIEHFYQTRWREATEVFDNLKELSPDDPRPYFFESLMPFWEYFFVHQQSELAELFLERSEQAVKLGSQKLDKEPNDTTIVLLLSGLHGYRSLVAAGEKKYRIAMQSGITGFSYTRQLLSMDSERPDAQIGRGMFFYMAGSVPKEVRWLTNAAGIRGDIETGFNELEKAAASDNPIKYDAQMMLMYLHEKEGNYGQALLYARMLAERFTENVIFIYKCGELYTEIGEYEQAVERYKKVISMNNSNLRQIIEISKERIDTLYGKVSKVF